MAMTETAPALPPVRVSVTSTVPPSSATVYVAGSTAMVPASSLSWIVIVLTESPSEAPPVGLLSTTVKLSFGSSALSSMMVTSKNFGSLSPAAQLSVPALAVKSSGETAVPSAVAASTLTAPAEPPRRSTRSCTEPTASLTVVDTGTIENVPGLSSSRLPPVTSGMSPAPKAL